MPTLAELIEMRRAVPPPPRDGVNGALFDRFLLPPFSVLNARDGWWAKRKKAWVDLGVHSGNNTELNGDITNHVRKSSVPHVRRGSDPVSSRISGVGLQSSTSVFDPVVCEIAYRWFCPPEGHVLDPFAGSSVGGLVAGHLERRYTGVDLRQEQVDANYRQKAKVKPDADVEWKVGDSVNICEIAPGEYDLLFSCPPYADLETYTDDLRDLSALAVQGYDQFLRKYRAIIAETCALLRQDRFACIVIGDVRDKRTGNYRGLVCDTIAAFRDAGLELYNQAILVTMVGSLSIRVGMQFSRYRKLGNTHQHFLVFLKGNARRATEACGQVDVDDLDMPEYQPDRVAVLPEGYTEVVVLDLPLIEACLTCDIARGQARAAGEPIPRCWVSNGSGWLRVEDNQELTYIVGSRVYLSRMLFPNAPVPGASPLMPKKLRGG